MVVSPSIVDEDATDCVSLGPCSIGIAGKGARALESLEVIASEEDLSMGVPGGINPVW